MFSESNDALSSSVTDLRARRLFRVWELNQQGWKQRDIVKVLDGTPSLMCQQFGRARDDRLDALCRGKASGATLRLMPEQKAQIPELLERGAIDFGFSADVWTRKRGDGDSVRL